MLAVVLVGCNKENDPEEQKLTTDATIESTNDDNNCDDNKINNYDDDASYVAPK